MSAHERVVYAALVAAVTVVAPALLFVFAAPPLDERWLAAWLVLVGPLIFQLLSRPRPEWSFGLAFSGVVALALGIWGVLDAPFEYSGTGQLALMGVLIFATTFVVGMAGASLASVVAGLFDLDADPPRPPRLRPWHVGAAIAAADVIGASVLAAVYA